MKLNDHLHARKSEQLLKEERDNLEILVERRTRELRETEQDRVSQLSRFAEFGKRSAGLFHDLLGPLGALAVTIGGLHQNDDTSKDEEARQAVSNAIDATRRMQQFMDTIRRQLAEEETLEQFSVQYCIDEAIRLTHYQSVQANVTVAVTGADVTLYGNPFKFTQVITNLLTNAIESFDTSSTKRLVSVHTTATDRCVVTVSDTGAGIAPEVLPRIFSTFYTTKSSGIGLGLSSVKEIIEKSFGGTISCESTPGIGTIFTVSIPLYDNTYSQTAAIDPGAAAT